MLEVEGGTARAEELKLHETVQSVIQLVEGLYRKDQNIENNVGEDLAVRLEPAVVSICLRNLLSNAAKFTPRGGRIEVNAFRQSNKLQLVVTDYGTGMSEEQVNKLFALQSRLRVRGTERESGSGLGLFLVRDLLKDLGGDLTVESMPGVGSSFTLILPLPGNDDRERDSAG
jgi:signal transduction histidine kinase